MGGAIFVLAAVMPSAAVAATPKCFGKPATIVSSKATINGTKKDDVIVSKNASGAWIEGKGGNDFVCGGRGDDFLLGGGGKDKLKGNGGSDALLGQGGNDLLVGDKDGGLLDMARYDLATGPISIDLQAGRATGEGTDTFKNIDGVWGSYFGDTVTGSDGVDFIFGNPGDDNIAAGGDLDLVMPGEGDDIADGGSLTDDVGDIYYVSDATGPVDVDLQTGNVSQAPPADPADGVGVGSDAVTEFEHVVGSAHNDSIKGDDESNFLFGGPGDDSLQGRGGFDYAAYWFAAAAVDANLQTGTTVGEPTLDSEGNQIGEGTDTMSQIEGLLGSIGFDDTLTGDNNDNYLDGDRGTDTITAGGGNDWIVGGLGANEQIDGGPGEDFWDYYGADSLNVNLPTGQITSPSLGTLQIAGIESVAGADGDDTFVGDPANNTFYGWGGNDYFVGNAGDDRFDGGGGTDTADPGEGNDTCAFIEVLGGCEVDQGSTPIPPHELSVAASTVESLRRNF